MSHEPNEGSDQSAPPPPPLPYRSGIDDAPPRAARWWWPFARLVIYALISGFLFFLIAAVAIFGPTRMTARPATGALLVMFVTGLAFFRSVRSAISIARGESDHPFAE